MNSSIPHPSQSKANLPFLWGAATSSHQIEGHNQYNDWWAFEKEGKTISGECSGAAADHYHRFKEDLGLAKNLALNAYRFSIEWSRLEPEQGRWDESGFEFYENILSECERIGLTPMLTLHHFTSPQWFAKRGGFAHPDSPKWFQNFVDRVVEAFGKRVQLWCTVNEPMVLTVGGYLANIMPPGLSDPHLVGSVCSNLLRCHVGAYDAIHSKVGSDVQVGFANNMIDFLPNRSYHPMEQLLTYFINRFYNFSWTEATAGGPQNFSVPGIIPSTPPVEEAKGRKTADFIGINYYTKGYVHFNPAHEPKMKLAGLPIGVDFAKADELKSDLDWAIHPEGFRKFLTRLGKYNTPIYITENGIADSKDKIRPSFILKHLKEVAEAMDQGVDIRGYFHWSLLDNFEWAEGFGPRFGLYEVNYSNFERKVRKSAHLYREIVRAHNQERPKRTILDRMVSPVPGGAYHEDKRAPEYEEEKRLAQSDRR